MSNWPAQALRRLLGVNEEQAVPKSHEDGHFYSPICHPGELNNDRERIWPDDPDAIGIDYNDASHKKILEGWFPKFIADFSYPEFETPGSANEFFIRNSQFSWLDCRTLFVLLRAWQPKLIIEIGSGHSSLLTADLNHRFFDSGSHFHCIDPFPREFLKTGIPGLSQLTVARVQDVPIEVFEELQSGDVLFVDSSHVAKTGSDVNHIFLKLLPRLAPGVRIHTHDIFLPYEYPEAWAIHENRSWNEQYLLQALLMFSSRFRVLFGSANAYHAHAGLVERALDLEHGAAFGGGSFWIERI